jgi:hypothetical protein
MLMPKVEKEKLDRASISVICGNLSIRIAILLALLGGTIYLELMWATFALLAFMLLDPCITLFLMARKNREIKFLGKYAILTVGITLVAFVGVGFLFYYGEKGTVVNVSDNTIQIKGMYGLEVEFAEVKGIYLLDESIQDIGVNLRNNGYGGIGGSMKGHFSSKERGKVRLFVQASAKPTILIERFDKENIYLNYKDAEKTRETYYRLIER